MNDPIFERIFDVIDDEWNRDAVNIDYLTTCVIESIEYQLSEHGGLRIDDLANLERSGASAPINAILKALMPDELSGSSHRDDWLSLRLGKINKLLVEAYVGKGADADVNRDTPETKETETFK